MGSDFKKPVKMLKTIVHFNIKKLEAFFSRKTCGALSRFASPRRPPTLIVGAFKAVNIFLTQFR